MSFLKVTSLEFLAATRSEKILHKFDISPVDQLRPDDKVTDNLVVWRDSEKGKWCCENATDLQLVQGYEDHLHLTVTYAIIGKLTEKQITYFNLKFT